MKIPKMKFRVKIVCSDDSFITGFLHVDEGYRLLDFLNETRKKFIAITNAKFYDTTKIHSFKLHAESSVERDAVLLNKNSIRWVEEVG